MIALPKYVRPVVNPIGRTYYFFHRGRGTPSEWPPVRLPDDPISPEFASRTKLCERLSFEDGTLFFVDISARKHTLPSPKDNAAFWSAVDKAEEVGRQLAAGERKTFRALIAEYKDHTAYTGRADSTRREYDRYIDMILAAWGDESVSSLSAVDAQKAIDSYKDTPAAARFFRSVLSRIISWGVPRGYAATNPIEHTEKIEEGGTYSPWPDWAFELFMEHGRVSLHLPVYSGLYTGQRSVDIMRMRRPAPRATEMPIYAQKTKLFVPVQIHSEYRQIVDAVATDHVMLHLREDAAAWTLAGFRTAWQREFTYVADGDNGLPPEKARAKEAAFKRLREARVVFHGLRKNAVIALLEAGCTEAEVSAIVGMSEQMVRHYSQEISARRLAINAMKKLEAGWGEIRKNVLGKVRTG